MFDTDAAVVVVVVVVARPSQRLNQLSKLKWLPCVFIDYRPPLV